MPTDKEKLGSQTSPNTNKEVLEPRSPFSFSIEAKTLVQQAGAYFVNDYAELVAAIMSDDIVVAKVFAPLLTRSSQALKVGTLSEALDDMGDTLFLELIKSLQVQSKLAELLDRELETA